MANEGWNFTADSELQKTLADDLNKAADQYDDKVKSMYKEINSMGSNNYWVGEDYNAFKTETEGYKNALKDLSNGVRMYSKHFKKMSKGTEQLASELIEIVENMTGNN